MNQPQSPQPLPAPCIIDTGLVINKEDMRRLLNDVSKVHYLHTLDGLVKSEGEGWVIEVFADPKQATLVTNGSLYINVHSFDYLLIDKTPEGESYFELVQENRCLRLTPQINVIQEPTLNDPLDVATLEAMVSQVLSARWDVQLDDDGSF